MDARASLPRTGPADFLLSWDRLGFRILVFGGLGLMWVIQGVLYGQRWPELVRVELGTLMPWAFLAPLVLAWGKRARIDRLGLGRFLAAHLLGMLVVFVPTGPSAAGSPSFGTASRLDGARASSPASFRRARTSSGASSACRSPTS